MAKTIVGQEKTIDCLFIGLLTRGHLLLEGVPGLAKTKMVRALAHVINARFKRIQFTLDLLPSDLVGTEILNPGGDGFLVRKGPIFNNVILADEINRAPSKVQSALLEAMQENQVTIGLETFLLPAPFLVLATQNPIEQEGTYPLAEAQIDRFMMKIHVDYPDGQEEEAIVKKVGFEQEVWPDQVLDTEELAGLSGCVRRVHMDPRLLEYVIKLVRATRGLSEGSLDILSYVRYGASPRAGIALSLASRAQAFLNGRDYVTPADVKAIAPPILRHRIMTTYEAEVDHISPDMVIEDILQSVPVP